MPASPGDGRETNEKFSRHKRPGVLKMAGNLLSSSFSGAIQLRNVSWKRTGTSLFSPSLALFLPLLSLS